MHCIHFSIFFLNVLSILLVYASYHLNIENNNVVIVGNDFLWFCFIYKNAIFTLYKFIILSDHYSCCLIWEEKSRYNSNSSFSSTDFCHCDPNLLVYQRQMRCKSAQYDILIAILSSWPITSIYFAKRNYINAKSYQASLTWNNFDTIAKKWCGYIQYKFD